MNDTRFIWLCVVTALNSAGIIFLAKTISVYHP